MRRSSVDFCKVVQKIWSFAPQTGGQNSNTSSPSVNHTCWLADTTRISLHAHVCHDNKMKRPWVDFCNFNESSWSFAPQTG